MIDEAGATGEGGRTKECSVCRRVLQVSSFNRDSGGVYGRRSACRGCRSRTARARYQETRFNPEYIFKELLKHSRQRKRVCTLSLEQATELLYKPCHYCAATSKDTGRFSGLDRVDNSRGYEPGNVVPCCTPCNRTKSDFSTEQFVYQTRRIAKHTSKKSWTPNPQYFTSSSTQQPDAPTTSSSTSKVKAVYE